MSFTVYILKSTVDGTLYIGQTANVIARLQRHNQRREKSTKAKAPYIMLYTEEFKSRAEAIAREKKIKSYKSGEGLRKLLGTSGSSSVG